MFCAQNEASVLQYRWCERIGHAQKRRNVQTQAVVNYNIKGSTQANNPKP